MGYIPPGLGPCPEGAAARFDAVLAVCGVLGLQASCLRPVVICAKSVGYARNQWDMREASGKICDIFSLTSTNIRAKKRSE
jgi:hypothetical protein